MRYRQLGNTDLQVSVLGLGTMMFGSWGNPDLQACSRIVDTAIDAGINLIDTADIYDDGRSEEILGKCLAGRRDQVILATKFGNPMHGDIERSGGSRRWVLKAVEESLRRLDTEWIDVYQMHRPDPSTPIQETLGALDELVQSGKIRAVGTSTFPSEGLEEAQWAAQRAGYASPLSEQPPYSLLARHVERDVLPTCQRLEIGVVTWAPLNGGWLTGKYSENTPPRGSRAEREPLHFDFESPYHERKASAVAGLNNIAQEEGLTLPHLSLSFVLEHPAVTSALLGPRTVEQLGDLLGAENISLTTEALDQIDDLVKPGETINMNDAGQAPPELPLFP
jgi:aryl-alcohol dehydrogenase-like predicted oxidoreductase